MALEWGPPVELMLNNIPWGLCYQCCCLHSELQPSPASPGDPPRPLGRSSPGSYGVTALCWVQVLVVPCVHPPRVESLFPPALWGSCPQDPLVFKAKCSGGSSSRCQTLRLSWRVIFMWECPCVACMGLNFFSFWLQCLFSVWMSATSFFSVC